MSSSISPTFSSSAGIGSFTNKKSMVAPTPKQVKTIKRIIYP